MAKKPVNVIPILENRVKLLEQQMMEMKAQINPSTLREHKPLTVDETILALSEMVKSSKSDRIINLLKIRR